MTMLETVSGAGLREFATRQKAAANLAQRIKQALLFELEQSARATLVLSGGSSPVECFRILSTIGLPWHRIDVTLSDERNVPATHAASNEKLLKENLLRSKASGATFSPLQEGIGRLLPSACSLIGMGEDGHFASLFSDSPELTTGLTGDTDVVSVTTPSSPYSRTSMTLRSITTTRVLCLLVFGEIKRELLKSPQTYAINHLLEAMPVEIFWAP
tara:strand:+ start:379 stop:1023 length:645 start_codon:yes stop_codon:yes gene_type:complete